jgi:hypothetical protein
MKTHSTPKSRSIKARAVSSVYARLLVSVGGAVMFCSDRTSPTVISACLPAKCRNGSRIG